MATRPTVLPEWATVGADITEPTLGEKQLGWVNSTPADGAFQNWWQNLVFDWTVYFDEEITNNLIPIKNDFVDAEKDNAFFDVTLQAGPDTAGSVNDIINPGPHYLLCYSATKHIQTTRDFISYSNVSITTTMNFKAMAHNGAGLAIAVGNNAKIQRSTDNGLNWSDVTPAVGGSTQFFSAHDDGTNFVIGGENSVIGHSTDDGATWIQGAGTGAFPGNVEGFANSATRLVAVKNSTLSTSPTVFFSDDSGVNWTQTNKKLHQFLAVEYSTGLDVFVAGGDDLLQVSVDGVIWTDVLTPTNDVRAAAHFNNRFYFSAQNGFVYFSMNGFEWTEVDTVVSSSSLGSAFAEDGRNVFGEAGNVVVARSFQDRDQAAIDQSNANQYIPAINFINDIDTTGVDNLSAFRPVSDKNATEEKWVLPRTNAGQVHVFANQFNTSNARSTSLTGSAINGVAWDGTQFIAASPDGVTSAVDPDSTWATRITAGAGEDFFDIASDEAFNIAVGLDGANGIVYVSTPGTIGTWNLELTATGDILRAAATDGTSYCVVGDDGQIYSVDTDPTGTWTLRTTPLTTDLLGVAASPNGVFIATGASATVLRSDDGCITWIDISAKFAGLGSTASSISFDTLSNRFVLLDKNTGDNIMWASDTEGNKWVERPTPVSSIAHVGYGSNYGLLTEAAGPNLKTNLTV